MINHAFSSLVSSDLKYSQPRKKNIFKRKYVLDKYFKNVASKTKYMGLKPEESIEHISLLKALKKAKVTPIKDSTVSLLDIDCDYIVTGRDLLKNKIYVRKFYGLLFEKLRSLERVTLIGNPGIGKSLFQYYYLYRLVTKNEKLTADYLKRTDPPFVVCRQVGQMTMEVYFLNEDIVHVFPYIEPYYYDLFLQTLSTTSPDESRYKGFTKNFGQKRYMPVWELEEILSVASFMRENNIFPKEYEDICSEKNLITNYYEKFGGIPRHLFGDPDMQESTLINQNTAISEVKDIKHFLGLQTIENNMINSLIAQFEVPIEGENAFEKYKVKIFSNTVMQKLLKLSEAKSIYKSAEYLLEMIHNPNFTSGLFQEHISNVLTYNAENKRISWLWASKENISWNELSLHLEKDKTHWNCPNAADMKEKTLYVPIRSNFEFVDYLYKEDNVIYGIQVTMGQSHKTTAFSLKTLLSKYLKIPVEDWVKTFKCVVCPLPSDASKYLSDHSLTKLTETSKVSLTELENLEKISNDKIVWKVAEDFLFGPSKIDSEEPSVSHS